jgi:hypothetical protein
MAKPEVPEFRGALTIADVEMASGAEEHGRRVDEWARTTWDAYSGLQPAAREWVLDALGRTSAPAASR